MGHIIGKQARKAQLGPKDPSDPKALKGIRVHQGNREMMVLPVKMGKLDPKGKLVLLVRRGLKGMMATWTTA